MSPRRVLVSARTAWVAWFAVVVVVPATFGACGKEEVEPPVADSGVVDAAEASADTSEDTWVADDGPGRDGPLGAPTTIEDFRVPGTQVGDISPSTLLGSETCATCHSGTDLVGGGANASWKNSLMGVAGRDPLFLAQLATANQDAPGVGYYCVRCHMPLSIATGHAEDPTGSTLDLTDRDGVNCAFCHQLIDPMSKDADDTTVVGALKKAPLHYGNAQFVLDPTPIRRGPRTISAATHGVRNKPFFRSGDLCGTCHDVGNVETIRNPDGTYSYNELGKPAADPDPRHQFPLERTYTEWKLSAFASAGVDMGGRFGGPGATTVSTCQDCHMPRSKGKTSTFGAEYDDVADHQFAGASAWVLRIAAKEFASEVDAAGLENGALAAEAMVKKAASLDLSMASGKLRVKLTNESGHKIPTGHIEGRRIWITVTMLGSKGEALKVYGAYDAATATLDEATTTVFEMKVGLSPTASTITGYPAGETAHMSLADVIVKDNRIPPRGFDNASYEKAGAPVVGATYGNGQHWATVDFVVPTGAATAHVAVYYQTATREYVEALEKGNKTNDWGKKLGALWSSTGKSPPIEIVTKDLAVK